MPINVTHFIWYGNYSPHVISYVLQSYQRTFRSNRKKFIYIFLIGGASEKVFICRVPYLGLDVSILSNFLVNQSFFTFFHEASCLITFFFSFRLKLVRYVHGLKFEQLQQAIASSNANSPTGHLVLGTTNRSVKLQVDFFKK
jgi:hypothetical protein